MWCDNDTPGSGQAIPRKHDNISWNTKKKTCVMVNVKHPTIMWRVYTAETLPWWPGTTRKLQEEHEMWKVTQTQEILTISRNSGVVWRTLTSPNICQKGCPRGQVRVNDVQHIYLTPQTDLAETNWWCRIDGLNNDPMLHIVSVVTADRLNPTENISGACIVLLSEKVLGVKCI